MENAVSRPALSVNRVSHFVRYWWQRLLHNLPQKFLALLLAFALWFVATEDRRASIQQNFSVAVDVRDTTGGSEKRAVSGLNPASVIVTLSGSRQRLAALNASDIQAFVDITDLPDGEFSRTVRVVGPDATRSLKVAPTVAQGRIDAELSRTQPVILSVTAPPSDSVPRYVLAPRQVTVSGPSQVVGTVERVITEPVTLSQGNQTEARLLALDAKGKTVDVRLTPSSITVDRIDSGNLPIRSVPVRLSGVPSNLSVLSSNVEPSTVRLIGPAETLARISSVTASVVYRPGTFSAQPSLVLPDGVRALDRVTVQLTVAAK
ncbi:hypothetical protein FNU79_11595 [Deinococcus detaillensis]|uniref:YbbR-like domain-containing protein n=1 Tax=Deinococcus detaillensis TaxID=2592048 RepID=A0A553UUI2_9DEIO|nr:hypothetical protein FNU79_11595 [Deinococcus detaillensis]